MEEPAVVEMQPLPNRFLVNVQSEMNSPTPNLSSISRDNLPENGQIESSTPLSDETVELSNRSPEYTSTSSETIRQKPEMTLVFTIQLSENVPSETNTSSHQHVAELPYRLIEGSPPETIDPEQEISSVLPNQISVNVQTKTKNSPHQCTVNLSQVPEYSPSENTAPRHGMSLVFSIQLSENTLSEIDSSAFRQTVELPNPMLEYLPRETTTPKDEIRLALTENARSEINITPQHHTAKLISCLPPENRIKRHRMPLVSSNQSEHQSLEPNTQTNHHIVDLTNPLPEYSSQDYLTERHGMTLVSSNQFPENVQPELNTPVHQHAVEVINRLPEYSLSETILPRHDIALDLSENALSGANTPMHHTVEITDRLPEYSRYDPLAQRDGMTLVLSNQSSQLTENATSEANTPTRPLVVLSDQLPESMPELTAPAQPGHGAKPNIAMGPKPIMVVCPNCNLEIRTHIDRRPTMWTHFIAFTFCIIDCWICACLTYCLGTCNKLNHTCPNCSAFIGSYK